ncbi:hypothetical protein [Amycolatopsis sp. PS_44_ISF1]|uniref:hypothetical protein n=1 Tax=Amycolatopsis sp. PS_44_ISF1 TaxID=2974917 RepID=UPI0028DF0128|nr:hypothetical protein [Amycolatopsis sp. PS_44_ISF1]MDT8912814.1 hypothetical protein [Amycolatopsis sp. PS_44_ISF1]
MDGNPVIDRWLAEQAPALPAANPLSALLAVAHRQHDVPEDGLEAWGREVATSRRVVDQSEPAFIAGARRQGWSWERIAERLGLPDAETAAGRRSVLEAELIRTHPRNLPGAWRP